MAPQKVRYLHQAASATPGFSKPSEIRPYIDIRHFLCRIPLDPVQWVFAATLHPIDTRPRDLDETQRALLLNVGRLVERKLAITHPM
jgi:hypothetical protein